jgi:hypothetical protein
MATNTKPLKRWTTNKLKTAIQSGYFDDIQKSEAEGILRERERQPDRELARRTYNAAAGARTYSEEPFIFGLIIAAPFIVVLIIVWLVATSELHLRSGQAPKAAEPETSLLAAPSIETTDHETSSPVPSIAAPQEAPPAPSTEAAKPEASPPAALPIKTVEPEALPPVAPTVAEPKDASATPIEAAKPETSPSPPPTVDAPAEAPLPSPEAHPAPAIASPEEPPSPTPMPPNSASTEAETTAPAADATAPARRRTSTRPRRHAPPRQATDTWKKGIGIFGQ